MFTERTSYVFTKGRIFKPLLVCESVSQVPIRYMLLHVITRRNEVSVKNQQHTSSQKCYQVADYH